MKQMFDAKLEINRLLTPRKTLDPRLFNAYGQMHPQIRKQLLSDAQHIINMTIKQIKGLVVKDICLVGSCANYSWEDSSNIDLRIVVANESCPYISKEEKELSTFLYMTHKGSWSNIQFQLENRPIEITMRVTIDEQFGIFSLMKNEWLLTPDRQITAGLTEEAVWKEFNTYLYETNIFVQKLRVGNRLKQRENIEALDKFYKNLFETAQQDIQNYIIYKLLKYQGTLEKIDNLIISSWREYFSLK